VQFFHKDVAGPIVLGTNSGWIQDGTDKTGTAAILFDSSAPLTIGNLGSAALLDPLRGRLFGVWMATTIAGTAVFRIVSANVPADPAATSFPAESGQTVTVTRAASGPQLTLRRDSVSKVELRWRNRYLTP